MKTVQSYPALSKLANDTLSSQCALTSNTLPKLWQVKNIIATIVNGLSVLKLFELSNGDLLFS